MALPTPPLAPEAATEAADNANPEIQYLAAVGHQLPSADAQIRAKQRERGVALFNLQHFNQVQDLSIALGRYSIVHT